MAAKKASSGREPKQISAALTKRVNEYARLQLKLEQVDLAHARATEKQRKKLSEMYDEIRELFTVGELRGFKTDQASVVVTQRTVPNIVKWEDFLEYYRKNWKQAQDLLRKQISSTAYNERLKDGKTVPGIEPMHLDTVVIKPKRS